jgi:hypothetical protein
MCLDSRVADNFDQHLRLPHRRQALHAAANSSPPWADAINAPSTAIEPMRRRFTLPQSTEGRGERVTGFSQASHDPPRKVVLKKPPHERDPA